MAPVLSASKVAAAKYLVGCANLFMAHLSSCNALRRRLSARNRIHHHHQSLLGIKKKLFPFRVHLLQITKPDPSDAKVWGKKVWIAALLFDELN